MAVWYACRSLSIKRTPFSPHASPNNFADLGFCKSLHASKDGEAYQTAIFCHPGAKTWLWAPGRPPPRTCGARGAIRHPALDARVRPLDATGRATYAVPDLRHPPPHASAGHPAPPNPVITPTDDGRIPTPAHALEERARRPGAQVNARPRTHRRRLGIARPGPAPSRHRLPSLPAPTQPACRPHSRAARRPQNRASPSRPAGAW